MKKLALVLTLALVLAFAVPVFANPFSDVPADHWAYDAISKLYADGVVTGNPDGTYTGKRNMTRYEMATIIAKAMATTEANADKISVENLALINKLAGEFGSELNALGVRVANLEKKVGNVKFTGDARVRYIKDTNDVGEVSDSKYDGRIRLNLDAAVNDSMTISARLNSDNYNFSEDDGDANFKVDRLAVKYTNKDLAVVAGRQTAFLGKGTIIDDAIKGISVSAPVGKARVTLLHGRLDGDTATAGTALSTEYRAKMIDLATPNKAESEASHAYIEAYNRYLSQYPPALRPLYREEAQLYAFDWYYRVHDDVYARAENEKAGLSDDKIDLTAIEFSGIKLGDKATLGIDYGIIKDKTNKDAFGLGEDQVKVWGVNFDYALNKRVGLFAELTKSDLGDDLQKAAMAGVSVKEVLKKTDLTLTYAKLEKNSVLPGITTLTDAYMGANSGRYLLGVVDYNDKTDLFKVKLDHGLAKDTNLYLEYTTASGKTEGVEGHDNFYRLETGLEFQF